MRQSYWSAMTERLYYDDDKTMNFKMYKTKNYPWFLFIGVFLLTNVRYNTVISRGVCLLKIDLKCFVNMGHKKGVKAIKNDIEIYIFLNKFLSTI